MNNHKQAYIAIDLHANHSVIGYMNENGKYINQRQVPTSGKNLINQIVAIPAETKHLTIEQGNMTFAMAEKLSSYVDKLIVCDPRHNRLISRSANKNDGIDTLRLCKLLRLGELKQVWRPRQMGTRRLFYDQVKEYQRITNLLVTQKNQLQAQLRHWGINLQIRPDHYQHPQRLLQEAPMDHQAIGNQAVAKLEFIRLIARQKDEQFERVKKTGSSFWEINQFQKVPGIGPVGAHTFSGYIQTPHRFAKPGQLIRFCQLGVRKRSSDGRPLKSERLDKAGHSRLKHVSYMAWNAATKGDNEVNDFYQASLKNSNNETNARLNTQRKILKVLWTLWKHKRTYQPAKFYAGSGASTQ
jgi:transposase